MDVAAILPLQVVDLGPLGPVRCGRCKAYMNPYMRFMASGRSFTCNFCGASNPTPDAYFCHLGPNGRRRVLHLLPGHTAAGVLHSRCFRTRLRNRTSKVLQTCIFHSYLPHLLPCASQA